MTGANDSERELAFEPLADRGLFMLVDPEAPLPWPFHASSAEDLMNVTVATDTGIGFVSAGSDFFPKVRIRITPGPVEPETGAWDATGEAEISVLSGYLSLRSLMGDVAGMFDVEPGDWKVRWQVRGRDEAHRRWVEGDSYFHGVEEWSLQMCPRETSASIRGRGGRPGLP